MIAQEVMHNKAEKKCKCSPYKGMPFGQLLYCIKKYSWSSQLAPLFDHCEAFPDRLEFAQQRIVTAPLVFVNINQGLQVPVKCRCPMCFYLSGTHANVTLLPRWALEEYFSHTQHSVLLSTPNTQRRPFSTLPGSSGMHYAGRAFSIQHSYEGHTWFSCPQSFKMHLHYFYALTEIRDKVIQNIRGILVSCKVHSEQYGVWH